MVTVALFFPKSPAEPPPFIVIIDSFMALPLSASIPADAEAIPILVACIVPLFVISDPSFPNIPAEPIPPIVIVAPASFLPIEFSSIIPATPATSEEVIIPLLTASTSVFVPVSFFA